MSEFEKVSTEIYNLEGQIDTIKENLANRISDEAEMKKAISKIASLYQDLAKLKARKDTIEFEKKYGEEG
ncbi:MAG: hypothetical protein CL995_05020 [Euryarchaeota archaeon]|nr:hypothetical protein [Euryarchaeota archaeon]